VVERPRQDLELVAAPPAPALVADVVDRRAEHEAERLVAGVLDQQVLVDGEVGREEAGLVPLQAGTARLRHAFERISHEGRP
jgi:hypothetical protein